MKMEFLELPIEQQIELATKVAREAVVGWTMELGGAFLRRMGRSA